MRIRSLYFVNQIDLFISIIYSGDARPLVKHVSLFFQTIFFLTLLNFIPKFMRVCLYIYIYLCSESHI